MIAPRLLAQALYRATRPLLQSEAQQVIARFVAQSESSGYAALLPSVLSLLPEVMRFEDGITELRIESSQNVSPEITAEVAKLFGLSSDKVEVTTSINPELIGGLRAHTPDRVLDMSVRGKLENLRTAISVSP